jgi:hypothetical protein
MMCGNVWRCNEQHESLTDDLSDALHGGMQARTQVCRIQLESVCAPVLPGWRLLTHLHLSALLLIQATCSTWHTMWR